MNKKTKKGLIGFITAVIVAVLALTVMVIAVWLVCFGFGIEFKVRYIYPICAFIFLNKLFPIQLYHNYKAKK